MVCYVFCHLQVVEDHNGTADCSVSDTGGYKEVVVLVDIIGVIRRAHSVLALVSENLESESVSKALYRVSFCFGRVEIPSDNELLVPVVAQTLHEIHQVLSLLPPFYPSIISPGEMDAHHDSTNSIVSETGNLRRVPEACFGSAIPDRVRQVFDGNILMKKDRIIRSASGIGEYGNRVRFFSVLEVGDFLIIRDLLDEQNRWIEFLKGLAEPATHLLGF